jgi:hypothetical protein
MSGFDLIRMLPAYMETVRPPLHLASKFKAGAFSNRLSSKLKYDTKRTSKDIAFPVRSVGTGYHMNARDGFSSREVEAPTYMEGSALPAKELIGVRAFGRDPYSDPSFLEQAQTEMTVKADKLVSMIHGGVELQASQIFMGGAISLVDDDGNVVYSLDYEAAATHFPKASIGWAASPTTAVPITDILNLCLLIQREGKGMPSKITMNSATLEVMKATTSFKAAMSTEQRVYNGELGTINRVEDLRGAVRVGQLQIAPFVLDLYLYDEEYKHPETGAMTKFVPDDRYIIESSTQDLRCEFGAFARYPGSDGMEMVGTRLTSNGMLADIDFNAWFNLERTVWTLGIASCPLLIPVSIDTFGCGYTTT